MEINMASLPSVDESYKAVCLSSRYNLFHEIETMRGIVDAMAPQLRSAVESIFCDSKACVTYDVIMNPDMYSEERADMVEAAFRQRGGYNSVNVHGDKGSKWFDPYWPEYELETQYCPEQSDSKKPDVTISVVVHHHHYW
jgi:hypothetical protein